MLNARENNNNGDQRREGRERLVAVAVDKDKSSQRTLRWAVENFITRGQTVRLVHVLQRPPADPNNPAGNDDNQISEFFLPFRCYCSRRQIISETVVLEDPDVAKALIEYITQNGIETLLIGSSSKSGISRLFKATDIPGNVLKWAPDFCNVYVISKGKVGPVKTATRPVPIIRGDGSLTRPQQESVIDNDGLSYDELSVSASFDDQIDFSWASNGSWASSDGSISSFYENLINLQNNRRSVSSNTGSEHSFRNSVSTTKLQDYDGTGLSPTESAESGNDETRRLRIELKQTMDMYHAAIKEALTAKQKVAELQQWKRKQEEKIREAHPEEASTSSTSSTLEKDQKASNPKEEALASSSPSSTVEKDQKASNPGEEASTSSSSSTVEKDQKVSYPEKEASTSSSSSSSSNVEKNQKARCKEAFEVAVAARKFIELEVEKRVDEERKTLTRKLLHALGQSHVVDHNYQSLFHILLVLFIFYAFFTISHLFRSV